MSILLQPRFYISIDNHGPVFFPNNDISPLRRLRIQRAQEYGALWTKTWGQDITHVVVDKGLVFKDILTFLNIDSFPVSRAIILRFTSFVLLTTTQV